MSKEGSVGDLGPEGSNHIAIITYWTSFLMKFMREVMIDEDFKNEFYQTFRILSDDTKELGYKLMWMVNKN